MQISSPKLQQQEFKRAMRLMGNSFEITVVGNDKNWSGERIDDAVTEIKRIEKLLSTFDDNSQANQINKWPE